MKKKYLASIILSLAIIFNINGCSNVVEEKNNSVTQKEEINSENSDNENISNELQKEIKDDIDLVLSYSNGYDDTMKKHISEKNFYVCNYVEFYSLYIGELNLEKYESEIVNIKKENQKYKVYMLINMQAIAKDNHEGQGSEEAIGENVPVEVIVKEKDNEFYIESFIEYEDLEKAKELNDGFK